MPDVMTVINKIITEHHTIRRDIKLAGDRINDIEALMALHHVQTSWSQSSIANLMNKQEQLLQAVSFLEAGLKNHFQFEEETLPGIIGETMIKAIVNEHDRIRKLIAATKTSLSEADPEKLDHKEFLAKNSIIQKNVDELYQALRDHLRHEETILNMIKKSLEESQNQTEEEAKA